MPNLTATDPRWHPAEPTDEELDMNRISKTDIEDRAILNGMAQYLHDPQEDDTHMFMTDAEDQLNEEDIWLIWEMHEQASLLLAKEHDPTPDVTAWKFLSGMGADDECVESDGNWFYRDWEIGLIDGEWAFDHRYDSAKFLDVDLMEGLDTCDQYDQQLESLKKAFTRTLSPAQVLKFERVVKAVSSTGYIAGLDKAQELSQKLFAGEAK